MNLRSVGGRLLQAATVSALMYAAILLAFYLGVEEKSFLQRNWELVTGGGMGLIAGAAFFLVFGAIGWVSGAIYGAVGLIGLAAGGALGGLGLGAVVNVLRDPHRYNIDYVVFFGILLVGAAIALWTTLAIGRKFLPEVEPQSQPTKS